MSSSRLRAALFTVAIGVALLPAVSTLADTTDTTNYGSGDYGYCDYGSCTITLSSTGDVALDTVPTAGGSCTVQSDSISVETDNTNGYTAQVSNNDPSVTGMVSGSNTIPASSGTAASPVTLSNNTWGYRVDGLAGFGAGPTSSQSSASVPSVTFAGIPSSTDFAAPVASSTSPANPAVSTTVWYGLCIDVTLPSGSYSTQVVYTAVTN
jgi:hypothetical protein